MKFIALFITTVFIVVFFYLLDKLFNYINLIIWRRNVDKGTYCFIIDTLDRKINGRIIEKQLPLLNGSKYKYYLFSARGFMFVWCPAKNLYPLKYKGKTK